VCLKCCKYQNEENKVENDPQQSNNGNIGNEKTPIINNNLNQIVEKSEMVIVSKSKDNIPIQGDNAYNKPYNNNKNVVTEINCDAPPVLNQVQVHNAMINNV